MEDNVTSDSRNKPRRLEDETATYLQDIGPQLERLNVDNSEKEVLTTNVLDEIKNRIASAMSDRRTNVLMEKLCYLASLSQLLDILVKITPYSIFLARNRHASHVIQAICARLCYLLKSEGVGHLEEDFVKQIILSFSHPLLQEICWLSQDMNGSHVIRYIACLLAGIPAISERKGSGSKHPHSCSLSEPLDKLISPIHFYIESIHFFDVPDEFHECLGTAMSFLIDIKSSDLQIMIANASSSAVLSLLIRIMANHEIILGGVSLVNRLIKNALDWDTSDDNSMQTIYAMSGDQSGSYFLETTMECCDLDLFHGIVSKSIICQLKPFINDRSANFVIQAILRRVSVILSKSEDDRILECLVEIAKTILDPSILGEVISTRGGLVLWLFEAFSQSIYNDNIRELCCDLGKATISAWLGISVDFKSINDQVLMNSFLEKKINYDKKNDNTDKMNSKILDPSELLFSKILGSMLKCCNPEISMFINNAILQLSPESLKTISCSGQLSKAIIDILIDKSNLDSIHTLMEALKSSIFTISCHFAGQHVFRKLFKKCNNKDKETLVQVLNENIEKLKTLKEGRNLMEFIQLDLYSSKPEEWRHSMNLLSGRFEKGKKPIESSDSRADDGNDNSDLNKRKRKRKRVKKVKDVLID